MYSGIEMLTIAKLDECESHILLTNRYLVRRFDDLVKSICHMLISF